MSSPATIQSAAAAALRRSREDLIVAYEAMPCEKQEWRPQDGAGRPARDFVRECVIADRHYAEIVRSGSAPEQDWESAFREAGAIPVGTLVDLFRSGSAALGALIEAMTDEQLTRSFVFPYTGREMTLADFAFVPAWHNDYHCGQINYIQTLYGDWNDHPG